MLMLKVNMCILNKILFLTLFIAFLNGQILTKPKNELWTVTNSRKGEKPNLGIYQGNATVITNHRYLVSILKDGEYLCAGAIVSKTWVLTSGECTKNVNASDLTVVGGSKDGVTGVNYTVTQVVPHPNYGESKLDYDFSCLQIKTHFYYYQKRMLKLPTARPADDTELTAAGYGYTDSKDTSRCLLQVNMTWLLNTTCKEVYGSDYGFTWTDRMACAQNSQGSTLCHGDFGDAFVLGRVVYGLFLGGASSGFCSASAKPVVLADVFSVASWVHNVTGAEYSTDSLWPTELWH